MTRYYKKYLPYIIFFSTVLVGGVTLMTASQLQQTPEEGESVVPVGTEAATGTRGTITCEGSNKKTSDTYKVTLEVTELNENPDAEYIFQEGSAHYDHSSYTTDYTFKVTSYKKNNYDVARVDCVDKNTKDIVDGGAGKKCDSMDPVPDNSETRYNAVKLIVVDYANFCDGSSDDDGDIDFTGQSCDTPGHTGGYDICCQNPSTPNHKTIHTTGWFQVPNFGEFDSSFTTDFKYNSSVNSHCGSVQHDAAWASFLPHDAKNDDDEKWFVSCSGTEIFTSTAQTGYSCNQVEPECGDGNLDPGETCDPGHVDAPDNCRISGDAACTYCGDKNVDAGTGEVCDDGNNVDNDGCDATCQPEEAPPFCGDGEVGDDETCDPNAAGAPANCRADGPAACTYCGDGTQDEGEICDDSSRNGAACNADPRGYCSYCTDSCAVKVLTICEGVDLDGNGKVTVEDSQLVSDCFEVKAGDSDWDGGKRCSLYDFDENNVINVIDINAVDLRVGDVCTVESTPPLCESLTKESSQSSIDGAYPRDTEWTFTCTGSDIDAGDAVNGYEFIIHKYQSNEVLDTIRCLSEDGSTPSPQVGNTSCSFGNSTGRLQGYKFTNEGSFSAKCKVRDSHGQWSDVNP